MNNDQKKSPVPEGSIGSIRSVSWHPRYREGVLELFSNVPHKAQLWQWEFESNPFGKAFDPVLLVDREDQVVGFNGVMPIEATAYGEPIDALWSCDFHVVESWRGKGLGSQIKSVLHGKAKEVMAFGISDHASRVLLHLGWKPDLRVRNYRLLRSSRGIREWAFRAIQWLNRSLGLLGPRLSNCTITVQSTLPDQASVNELWEREKSGYSRIVKRSFEYLNWKYQRHPLARYAFVCAWEHQKLAAIMVVRFHGETLKIVDYAGPASNAALKRALVRRVRDHWRHALQLTVVTSDAQLGQCLRNEGFFSPRTRPRFYIHDSVASENEPSRSWFIMAGDSDGELLGAAAEFCRGYTVLNETEFN